MQPQVESRSVNASGVTAAGSFGMKAENSAHIFGILRSQLYSNKILAVLREYSANAWDSHRASGIPDRPIKVVLPTHLSPTLRIRDYGRGLSEDDVFDVYTQYGSSTKRQSDDVVGCLGIGSKSAFAYADSFTVTSWHGGQKSVYVAVLDESNVGTMSLQWRGICDPSDTGVEVSISVDVADCDEFRREASGLYPYFAPLPIINTPITPAPAAVSKHGSLSNDYASRQSAVAVMGCIPYVLDLAMVQAELHAVGIPDLRHTRSAVLHFNIGDVSISASRETLEYTKRTKEAIVQCVSALVAELKAEVERVISDKSISEWDRRLTVRKCADATGSSGSSAWGDYDIALYASLQTGGNSYASSKTFTLRRKHYHKTQSYEATTNIPVRGDTRIIIRDVNRALTRYNLVDVDRIVYPMGGASISAVQEELSTLITAAKIRGIPVVLLSSLPHDPTAKLAKPNAATPAAKERQFILNDKLETSRRNPSQNWSAVTRTPSPDDVYVILEGFQPVSGFSYKDFVNVVGSDRETLEWLGGTMPSIIGYRTSAKKPVQESTLLGTTYAEWRGGAMQTALEANPKRMAEVQQHQWARLSSRCFGWRVKTKQILETTTALFPKGHPIRELFLRISKAGGGPNYYAPRRLTEVYCNLDGSVADKATEALNAIFARYPLINPDNRGPNLEVLTDPERSKHWIDYINLIDKATA